MLRDADVRVLDVAVACGFKTQGHFARVFRRICGASPTECRQEFLCHEVICALEVRSDGNSTFAAAASTGRWLVPSKSRPVTMLQARPHAIHFKPILDFGGLLPIPGGQIGSNANGACGGIRKEPLGRDSRKTPSGKTCFNGGSVDREPAPDRVGLHETGLPNRYD